MRKSTYTKIGKSGTPDEVQRIIDEKLSSYHEWTNTDLRIKNLIDGALEALIQNRPGNFQVVMKNVEKIQPHSYQRKELCAHLLQKVAQTSEYKQEAISLALNALPETDRKVLLCNALAEAVSYGVGDEEFFSQLVEAGADFDKTLSLMHAKQYEADDIARLEFFRARLGNDKSAASPENAAVPPASGAPDAATNELIRQLLEQVTELTQEVKRQGTLLDGVIGVPKDAKESPPSLRSFRL